MSSQQFQGTYAGVGVQSAPVPITEADLANTPMFYMKYLGYLDSRTNNVMTLIERVKHAVLMDLHARKLTGLERYSVRCDIMVFQDEGTSAPILEYRLVFCRHNNGEWVTVLKGDSVEELFSEVNRARLYALMA